MTEPTKQEDSTSLTLNDLILMKDIIGIASSRATFKPDEFEIVGKLFNKVSYFIEAAQQSIATATSEESSIAEDTDHDGQ